MRVISRARLRSFWKSRTNDAKVAENTLSAWHKIAESVTWANWGELKQTFGTADRVGNCTVFDVGNNQFRVIGRVFFDKGRLYILDVMDHAEYDRKDNKGKPRWIDRCGCHEPPPTTKRTSAKRASPRRHKGSD